MSPDDIDEVRTRWRAALTDADRLSRAIAERLDGSPPFRTARGRWIIDAVTSLSAVLDHPGAFAPMAIDLLARRSAVTVDQLADDRDALLGAIDEVCGPLDTTATRSWHLAIGLFAEILCSVGLDPFATTGRPLRGSGREPPPAAGK
jgi:hypothetical protein